eukprot:TRINITY_DN5270_c0_g1_i1.p1 TRINITY_DN5270_c0_g1~~TRINITY_DN5270_c0_g1_i1.p1  ORF type:complete len:412 (-),score=80.91 TRINITY_DN5270_c0_g1_i1:151-1386(-)
MSRVLSFLLSPFQKHFADVPKVFYRPTKTNEALVKALSLNEKPFIPSIFLPNGHFQTVAAGILRQKSDIFYEREDLKMKDGGMVSLDWTNQKKEKDDGGPILLIMHGIFGGSLENYVCNLITSALGRFHELEGPSHPNILPSSSHVTITPSSSHEHLATQKPSPLSLVVLNFRGAGTTKLVTNSAYSAGWTGDVREVAHYLRASYPSSKILAVGFSLGANVLLKYLGEEGSSTPFNAAAAVSSPWDLVNCSEKLHSSFLGKQLYSRRLAQSAHAFVKRHLEMFKTNPKVDIQKILNTKFLWEFDDEATRKIFDFESVTAYYHDASSNRYINKIGIPTLCLSAHDDPIVHSTSIPVDLVKDGTAEHVILVTTATGGHVAWLTDLNMWHLKTSWMDELILDWFDVVSSHMENK